MTHLLELALAAFIAWCGGMLWALRTGRGWPDGLGAFLILWPAARALAELPQTLPLLIAPTVVRPLSLDALWNVIERSLTQNLLPASLGLAWLWLRGSTPLLPRSGAWRVAAGALPAAVILESAALVIARGPGQFLGTGETEQAFTLAPWWLAILLAVVPAAAEEIAWRGAILSVLKGWPGPRVAVWLQAILFGLAHAGWGDLRRVIAPAALGLGLGWAVPRIGLGGVIAIHAGLNLAFLALTPTRDQVVLLTLVAAAGLAATPLIPRALRALRRGAPG